MKTSFLRNMAAVVFTLISTMGFAQGTLRGVVTDSLTAEPLVGANVYLLGTALGSATNLEGVYRIDRVPEGTYTLRVSYIGYLTKQIKINIQNNKTLVVDAPLSPQLVEAGIVLVTAQAVGQAAAINQQITSNTIINVVSEEKIRELPDANAAESIGRLPGVSILRSGGEANKVILRGLEDKFTNITIDGVKIPPTDATSRGVDLSTLSQSSLAGIELYKAVTPDKDGDALAGSINLVTKKAPETRRIKTDLKGDYNKLMESANQYDLSFHYGERFFNNVLGVQLSGNLEKRIRSNERIDVDYNQSLSGGTDYFIDNFGLEFTDEIRKRDGFSVLFDLNTPDNGTIRVNNVYGRTKRDYLWSTRDYPSNGGGSQQGNPVYDYRDREQEINTFNSSIRGDNNLLGMNLKWGLSFGQSESDFPFDYEAIFVEPSGMRASPMLKTGPEQLISYAVNNFSNASLYWTYYRSQHNFDKERTAFLDLGRQYLFGQNISGEIKIGGKYKVKDRSNNRTEDFTPYYLGRWQPYELLPDGTFRKKDFTGTYFEQWQKAGGLFIPIDQFFSHPASRSVYGSYRLNPLIDRNRLRQWYELNRYGIDATKNQFEVWSNPLIRYDDHDVTERVGAGYIMNTLNLGQKVTVIAGLRVEKEDNDYMSTYMPQSVGGFPVTANTIRDTSSSAAQTVLLPNFNVAVLPLDFMKLRLAAYKALARPDFNMRLDRYIAGRPAEVGSQLQVYVGNPKLKTARAWNYEVNTSFFGNTIGLISLSAYYKEIDDMYHMLNNFNTTAVRDNKGVPQDTLMQRFGIKWPSQMGTSPYNVTLPYNSPKPTKVWGFEFEHQINFDFLPGLLRNIVLSYNASIVRSEAFIWASKIDSVYYDPPGPIPPTWRKFTVLIEKKQKLEGMPEFFGNIALGYDIGKFSGRVSLFHQGEHNVSYSASGLSDQVTNAFTRIDLALKQGITDNLSLFLNLSNVTNIEDGNSIYNRVFDRKLFNQSEKYGLTADFGITVQLE
ncbi:MAG: TonB-dependent receptor [candidate division KSB1 bacterium]|nr:TonB-dependent receptor [candidate division KSB1 bacterium]MDZ7305170.1 TonB-dependent receptor [candidate division KSB1 bacterium]MDZ7312941.1 TonB-dependent receptor [candidate division KSB1 bacterium]